MAYHRKAGLYSVDCTSGKVWISCEQYFQAMKFSNEDYREEIRKEVICLAKSITSHVIHHHAYLHALTYSILLPCTPTENTREQELNRDEHFFLDGW